MTTETLQQDARRERGTGSRLGFAFLLVVAGAWMLAHNLGVGLPGVHDGWALVVLFGAIDPAMRAVRHVRATGRLDLLVLGCVLSVAADLAVSLLLLLDVSFRTWWPLFLVVGGLHMLVSAGSRATRAIPAA